MTHETEINADVVAALRQTASAIPYHVRQALDKQAQKIMTKEQKAQSDERVAERARLFGRLRSSVIESLLADPRAAIAESVERKLSEMREEMADWAQRFSEDPAHALSWAGNDLFIRAARIEALATILSAASNPPAPGQEDGCKNLARNLVSWLDREHRLRATKIASSTSPTSNMMEEARRVVYAQLAGDRDDLDLLSSDALWISAGAAGLVRLRVSLRRLADAIDARLDGDEKRAKDLLDR